MFMVLNTLNTDGKCVGTFEYLQIWSDSTFVLLFLHNQLSSQKTHRNIGAC